MNGRRFQFSVKQLLLATAFIAGACGVAKWALRGVFPRDPWVDNSGPGFLLALFIVGGLLGAAVGTLGGRIRKGAAWGLAGVMLAIFLVGLLLP